jgi:hypothetical protein
MPVKGECSDMLRKYLGQIRETLNQSKESEWFIVLRP